MDTVEYLLQSFDFRKVRAAMLAAHIQWSFPTLHRDTFHKTPDVAALKKQARLVAELAIAQGQGGGLGFRAWVDASGLHLTFELERVSVSFDQGPMVDLAALERECNGRGKA